VALPEAEAPASIALRLIGAHKPCLQDNYWEVMTEKRRDRIRNELFRKEAEI
jgi:hypothetical protein